MANENDQQHHHHQSSSSHHNTSDLQTDCEKSDTTTMKTKTDTDNDSADHKEGSKEEVYYNNNEGEADHDEEMPPTASKGKLNDLVADLCINGHRPSQSQQNVGGGGGGCGGGYSDYKNSRAAGMGEGFSHQSSLDAGGGDNSFSVTSTASTAHNVVQPPTQNSSSFSFKHFLSSSSAPTAPSTTVTSLDPPTTNNSTSTTSSVSSSAISSRSLQTSTGARPKVPQSSSVTSTSISSLIGGGSGGGGLSASSSVGEGQSANATKMKRSPRFSSFDSQASLAEYAGASTTADLPPGEASSGVSRSSDYRLYAADERDRFAEWNLPSNSSTITTNSSDYDRGQYVPRSYSNYEMPRPQTSPRRRVNVGANRDSRPTRLTLNTNSNPKMAAKLKLDLPLNQNNSSGASSSGSGGGVAPSRKKAISTRSSDFQAANPLPGGAAAAAAALPDFVQDHWMDSWYANDMHVNSPPSSPIAAFAVDMPGSSGDQASGGMHRARHSDNNPLPGPAEMGGFQMGLPEQPSSSVGSKMLPDFLSDGPIIHSSQRLADIATGLPSNSVGSPEDSNMTCEMSRLRSDNEILQRELNETRAALNEQTLRANNLERQLLEQQRQHKSETEETSDSNKKHSTAVQNHVHKLKQQIQQLTADVEVLRREKELMREEGAVGGCSVANCDRSPYVAAATVVTSSNRCSAAASAAAAGVGGVMSSAEKGKNGSGSVGVSSSTSGPCGGAGIGGGIGIRPSRAQQISRDLRRAASNAEQNLRQLLAGVDNLRQMASNIEKSDTHVDYDASPDLFSDFLDDCDDYDEYPGGPALQLLAGVDNLRQMASNIEKSDTHVDYDASPDLFSDFLDDCDDYDEYPGGPAL